MGEGEEQGEEEGGRGRDEVTPAKPFIVTRALLFSSDLFIDDQILPCRQGQQSKGQRRGQCALTL
jgi:hypothetical protein